MNGDGSSDLSGGENFADLAHAAAQLDALGDPLRLETFRLLVRAGEQGAPVGEVRARLGVAHSTFSHHLHKLIAVELVRQERRGVVRQCIANFAAMKALVDLLASECCADATPRPHDPA